MTAFQGHDESARAFLSRMSGLVHSFFENEELREKLSYNQALAGLNSQIRCFVMIKGASSFDEIWECAVAEEHFSALDKSHAQINVVQLLSNRDNQENVCESQELDKLKRNIEEIINESDKKIFELTEQIRQLTLLIQENEYCYELSKRSVRGLSRL